MGLPYSLNKAISHASGKYIARMDADDISFPERIEEEIFFLEKNNFDMVASNRIDIDEDGRIIRENRKVVSTENLNRVLPYACVITHPSILIRIDVIKELGGYREIASVEDYDLWLRMLTFRKKIGIIDRPLLYYRIRSDSIGRKDNLLQRLMTEYVQRLYLERKKKGKDSYSNRNIQIFLETQKYSNIKEKQKYNTAVRNMEEGLQNLRNRRGLCIVLLKSLKNKHIRRQLKELMIINIYYKI